MSGSDIFVKIGERTSSRVLCVLVNFHDEQSTSQCIRSIREMSEEADHQVVVVDNEADKLNEQYLTYGADHVISCGRNLGFGGGVNLAIKELQGCEYEFIWLLNNDALATHTSLSALLISRKETQADIVGSTIFYLDDPELLWCKYSHCHKPWHIVQNIGKKKRLEPGYVDSEVNFVNGCSMLISRAMFEKLDGFDESLFLYAEDLDLCIKCIGQGGKLVSSAGSRVFHAVSASTGGEFNLQREYYIARNGCAMVNRYSTNILTRLFALITRILWDAYRFFRTALRSGDWSSSARYLVRAIRDGWLNKLGRL